MKPSKIEVSSYKGRRFTWQKAVLTVLALGLAGFLVLFGLVLGGAHSQLVNQPQTMIVLGCKVHGDGTPSVLLRDRLDTALDYWQEHQDVTILVSGGQGPDEPEAEADAMADYLEARGVPRRRIWRETESHNTAQNLALSRALLEEKGQDVSGCLVVSNGFHLTRVRLLWDRVGEKDVPLSTLAAPASNLPARLRMYLREPAALLKSFLLDR